MAAKRPKVGVCLCLIRDGKILLHKRKGGFSSGLWGFPGGHLEFGESFEQGALRELAEEAGHLQTTTPELWTISNNVLENKKHYVVIYMRADWVYGEAEVMEPNKCESWEWFPWDDLPKPLMEGIKGLKQRGLTP